MAIDPDEAIEKLSQYREEAKTKEKDKKIEEKIEKESPVRRFFVHFYKFNLVLAITLGFALLFSGFQTLPPAILWISVATGAFLIAFLTMRTITRLNVSDGRKTTIDDGFVILLLMLLFFGYLPYLEVFLGVQGFRILHIILVIIWFTQIYFVNFRKPDISTMKMSTGGIIEKTGEVRTTMEKLLDFLTRDRLVYISISVVLAAILSFFQFA